MNPSAIVAHLNERLATSYRIVGQYAAGESGAALQIIDEHSNRYVLKTGSGGDFRAENAARTTQRLRGLGYPAPQYVATGTVAQTSYSLQRAMRGEPIGSRASLALLPQLLHLNDLQRGQGEAENDEPGRIIRGVMEGYADFCIIDALRTFSTDSAALLDALQRIVETNASACPKRNDVVHFDFHTNNILIEDDRVTGVIDWEGSESGDRAFDLATLLFYTWEFDDFRNQLRRALLQRTPLGAVAVYLAHMIVRQLDWSIRHHTRKSVVDQYLRISQAILREIEHS
jgi:aminoglycoside phosphotransferase (APT) family kinase protein